MATTHSEGELRFFTFAKCVVNYSSAALRLFFIQKWNSVNPSTPWQNNTTSGSCLLAREKPTSRLFHPSHCSNYQHIKNHLRCGNVENWDITTLVFAILYSSALNSTGVPYSERIINAIKDLRNIKNIDYSHITKASVSRTEFLRVMNTLYQATGELLTFAHPLVCTIHQHMTHDKEFLTHELVAYKKRSEDDHNNLLSLEKDFEELEAQLCSPAEGQEKVIKRNKNTQENGEIILRLRHRVKQASECIDQAPSLLKPDIFRKKYYITLINESNSLSFNFRWKDLEKFLEEYTSGYGADKDINVFAHIQAANALSLQSKKEKSLKKFNHLLSQASKTKYG